MRLLHDTKEIISFHKYVSQYLNIDVTNIQNCVYNKDSTHPFQGMLIRSTDEQIEQMMLNNLLTPFGLTYRYHYDENIVQIIFFTEMDCLSRLEDLHERKQHLELSIDKDFTHELETLVKQIEELTYCMENNYWRTYQGQSQICK